MNRSGGYSQPRADTNQSGGAVTGKKDPSILKPSGASYSEDKSGGTIGIISKPKIDPKVEPKKDNYVKPTPVHENTQPEQHVEEEIGMDVNIQGIGKKNKFNKPGYLRKGKKVAENFKFAE